MTGQRTGAEGVYHRGDEMTKTQANRNAKKSSSCFRLLNVADDVTHLRVRRVRRELPSFNYHPSQTAHAAEQFQRPILPFGGHLIVDGAH